MPTVPAGFADMIDAYMRETGQVVDRPISRPREDGPKPSKYRNAKVEVDGRTFDSKKEASRYMDLREEQRAGSITGLRCQVAFPLTVNGTIVASYVADFVYTRDGREVIEDVKSVVTRKLPVYRLKAKIMAALGHTISEV